ncbi:MAG: FAD-dependent oxidoreductase [bacterium]|nr:FAD-dependent oxidoreductase [bacterium]MDZ4296370.1 FAD-dependent oxidoreductase [Patescibacteria group bacterium]
MERIRTEIPMLERRVIAERTVLVTFAKPEGFSYRAGQYLSWTVPGEISDERGNVRPLSLASSPTEDVLMIAVRQSASTFKTALERLNPGDTVRILGPLGGFGLEETAAEHVMIAGGIGVTPFRSMIKNALDRSLAVRLLLLSANRTPEAIPFHAELGAWADGHDNFSVVQTITDPAPADWRGERSRMDASFIRRCVPDLAAPIFYVVGPPGMVDAAERLLREELGIPEERVRVERFTGY